jgi:hypothetical protein
MERCAVLGSALKRKAAVLAATGAAWADVETVLRESREAYACGEGSIGAPGFDAYAMLNRLQLDWLLLGDDEKDREARKLAVTLATQCAEAARRQFAQSGEFFDAVKPADAELTRRLLARLDQSGADELVKTYRDAVAQVPRSARKFDSVVNQICLLARFAALRGRRSDKVHAALLAGLAGELGEKPCPPGPLPTKAPPDDAPPPSPDDAPPPAKARRPRKASARTRTPPAKE